MIQEVWQCVSILKNFERNVEELLNKCDEVRKQHLQDIETIKALNSQIEDLKRRIEELQNERRGTDEETKGDA